jgi:hypothetical protein
VSLPWLDGWGGAAPRRLPKLTRKPAAEQLALF